MDLFNMPLDSGYILEYKKRITATWNKFGKLFDIRSPLLWETQIMIMAVKV